MTRSSHVAALLSIAFLAGCGSAGQDPAGVIPPLINIRHVGGMPPMRSGTTVPIYFELDVVNQSSEPITLDRVQLSSSSSGSFEILSRTEYFHKELGPGEGGTVNIPANARIFSAHTSSVEPITMRAIVHFDSPLGKFRRIVIQQLGGGIGSPR